MEKTWRLGLAVMGAAALVVGITAQARPRPEVALLGVRVFTPATQVVKQFGNPSMITNTQITITDIQGQGPQQGGAPSGGFGMGGEQGGMQGPSGGPPGFGQPPRGGDFGGGTTGQTRIENEIVYVYRAKGGSTYLFQFNKDGRTVQISAYGRRSDPRVRTSRGVGLGDPYSKVVSVYGHPDEHAFGGDIYAIRYNKLGVAFQLEARTNRVTGIFVAAGIPTLGAGFTGLGGGGNQQASGGIAPGGQPGRAGERGGGGGGAAASANVPSF
ncbi:MAG: hypothetical protein N2651_07195 [Fimbriimonadales bacterium]|nr:hypothetical protein [Fimbriimonadales bacterium]